MSTPNIAMIWAATQRGLIGRDGWMPWRLPNDLARFRKLTIQGCVLMGHTTFNCLGRPLQKRDNLVLRRKILGPIPGVTQVTSIQDALTYCQEQGHPTLWIIGGAQVYKLALPLATRLELTLVHDDQPILPGDTCFSFEPQDRWRLEDRRCHTQDDKHDYSYTFLSYQRVQPHPI